MKNEAEHAVPPRRTEDLVVRVHGEETLALDKRTGTVHCLPAEVARVWGACTGTATLAEIASAAGIDEETASAAADEIMRLDLLEARAGFDRRKFIRRGALASAGAAAVIESVIALPARAAASPFAFGQVTFTPDCVGTGTGNQARFSVTFSNGQPGLAFDLTATAIPPGGGSQIGVTESIVLDSSGNDSITNIDFPPSGFGTSTTNVFGIATTITLEMRTSDGVLLGTVQETMPPCFVPNAGEVIFTPGCGANGQAQWGAQLSKFDNLSILTVTATAVGASGPVSATVQVTTDNGGTATIGLTNFGNPNDFNVLTPVIVTVSEGGAIVPGITLTGGTIGPCPPLLPAGASRTMRSRSLRTTRSGSSPSKSASSRTEHRSAPSKSSSTTPEPTTKPSASPSPRSSRATRRKP